MTAKLTTPALSVRLSDGTELSCGVRRSMRARQVRLRLSPQGQLELVLPLRARLGEDALRAMLQRFTPWAERAWRKLGADGGPEVLTLPELLEIPLTGRSWEVRRKPAGLWPYGLSDAAEVPVNLRAAAAEDTADEQCLRVVEDGGVLFLTGDTGNTELCCKALQQWIFRLAERELTVLVRAMASRLGFQVNQIHVRRQRGRWGSCTSDAHISLNFRAMLLPVSLSHYLVLHELCHLAHMNHSAAYRAFVARFEPDWRQRERGLSLAWRDMPAWIMV